MAVRVEKISDGSLFEFSCPQWALMEAANKADWIVLENTCGLVTLFGNPYAASEFFYTLDGRVAAEDPLQIVTVDGISTINFKDQPEKTFLGGPVSGAGAYPEFRPIQLSDLPIPAGTAPGQILRWNNVDEIWEIYSGTTDGHVLTWDATNGWQSEAAAGGVSDGDKGDITVSGSGTVWTIDDDVVTDSKLRNSAALSVIGNSTNATANPADIVAAGDGDVLRRSGTNLAFGKVATAGIDDNAVTNPKLRDSAALSVIGRSANSAGDPADISAGTDGHVLRRSGTTLGFGTVATAGIADDAVTYAKIQNVVNNNRLLGRVSGANGVVEELTVAQIYTLLSLLNGANERIPFYTGANGMSASDNLKWNNTNRTLTVNTTGGGNPIIAATSGAITGATEFIRMSGNVNGNLFMSQLNANNGGSGSNTIYQLSVGGSNAGDALIQFTVSGQMTHAIGIDNTDDRLKLTPNASVPGGNANMGLILRDNSNLGNTGVNKDFPVHPIDGLGYARFQLWGGTGNEFTAGNIFFGSGAGTGPNLTSIVGMGNAVRITFSIGTAPTANGDILVVSYPFVFPVTSIVTFSARDSDSAENISNMYISAEDNGGFTLKARGTMPASTGMIINLHFWGY